MPYTNGYLFVSLDGNRVTPVTKNYDTAKRWVAELRGVLLEVQNEEDIPYPQVDPETGLYA